MTPSVISVLHPTDFTEGSRVAFYHALKAGLLAKSKLTLLNVSLDGTTEWADFPGVRETLERWGLLAEGSQRAAVSELGLEVRKVIKQHDDPVEAVLGYLKRYPADLIVLATQQREGRVRWLENSVAAPVARQAFETTLFIPGNSDGFVSATDGSVSLHKILIPVAATPRPQPAIDEAVRLVARLDCRPGTFTLMHVGQRLPAVRCPEIPGWEWQKEVRDGDVIQTIVDAANEMAADLIVMATDGRNGFLDGLRGSHSERVLRLTSVPLLTVPVAAPA